MPDWRDPDVTLMHFIVPGPGTPVRLAIDMPRGCSIRIYAEEEHIRRSYSFPAHDYRLCAIQDWVHKATIYWRNLHKVVECVAREQIMPKKSIRDTDTTDY